MVQGVGEAFIGASILYSGIVVIVRSKGEGIHSWGILLPMGATFLGDGVRRIRKFQREYMKNYGVTDLISGKICNSCYHSIKEQGIEVWVDNSSINVYEAYQTFLLGGTFLMTDSNQTTCPIHNIKVTREVREKSKARVIL